MALLLMPGTRPGEDKRHILIKNLFCAKYSNTWMYKYNVMYDPPELLNIATF